MPNDKKSAVNIFILSLNKEKKLLTFTIGNFVIFLLCIILCFVNKNLYICENIVLVFVVLISVICGKKMGIITSFFAGFLVIIALLINNGINVGNSLGNGFFQLSIYVVVSIICGYMIDLLMGLKKDLGNEMAYNKDTGIPNMNLFSIIDCNGKDLNSYNVITIIINNNNNIIDLLGIDIYNNLLSIVYRRLKANISEKSMITQPEKNKLWIAKQFVDPHTDIKYILSILQEPLNIDDIPLYVEFSLGITQVKGRSKCLIQDSYRNSDIAARYAQKNKLLYAVYTDDLIYKSNDFELLGVFSKALEDYQTKLVYQPKFDLKTNLPIGLEALIRWEHPKYGLIDPGTFIPLVEGTQLIHLLTEWVINQVVKKIIEFKCEKIDINISLNLSAKNLFDPDFVKRVLKAVSSISPDNVELEITESVLMSDPEESKKILKMFVDEKIKVTLDDFGRGYSSLAYLSQFPINTVKLDQYFMPKITNDNDILNIVKATIDLAHKLGYKVIAEGVETKEVLNILKELDCDMVQGFYLSKPIKDNEIISWYKKNVEH